MRRRNSLIRALFAAAVLAGCKDESPPVPGSLAVAAGDQQAAVVGAPLPTAPAVLLKDTKGRPMNGVVVTWVVTGGGGSLGGAATVKTGADGIARAGTWTLGTAATANTLTATVQGLPPVVFTAAANAGAPASMTASTGDGQSVTVGTPVPLAPEVTVKDNFGNPVPNVAVTFVTTVGGGTVTGGSATTGAAGTARVGGWTLGTSAGLNTLTATAGSASTTFTAVGTAGPATQMAIAAGDGQSIAISTAVPIRPAVVVRDQYGNGVTGVTVVFAVASGGGTVTGATQVTGTAGIAAVGSWQLGSALGPNTLVAQSTGLNSVTFTATGTDALVYTMSINGGNGQTAPAGWTVGEAPSVVVRDQFGNPGSGVPVTFTIAAGNGNVTEPFATTDANGVARVFWWRLGNAVGANNSLVASAPGLGNVTFTAATVAPPAADGYHISIAYTAKPTARQHQAVLNAVTRWQQVITGDLSDFNNFNLGPTSCSPTFVDETIDDILVLVDFSPIDGAGNILGQAGPCLIRSSSALTVVGRLKLDAADLTTMENNGTIDDVITHEIGHILGIGSLWTHPAKLLLSFATTDSSAFTGAAARVAFLANGGNGFTGPPVPAENCKTASGTPITGCGSGTRDAHWREAVLGRELMTGYISPSGIGNPLSAITIQSLADLGYAVDAGAADSFTVGTKPIPGAEPAPIHLREAKPNWTIQTVNER